MTMISTATRQDLGNGLAIEWNASTVAGDPNPHRLERDGNPDEPGSDWMWISTLQAIRLVG
jgi:hypothetical protein